MDSSPMTQGAANSFLPKKASRTDMERVVVVAEVGAMAMVRRRAVEVAGEVKALAEPRADARRMLRKSADFDHRIASSQDKLMMQSQSYFVGVLYQMPSSLNYLTVVAKLSNRRR
eukprot:scaffold33495_cov105-Skeletonema_dohrnii-CCMP3373.AAC.1